MDSSIVAKALSGVTLRDPQSPSFMGTLTCVFFESVENRSSIPEFHKRFELCESNEKQLRVCEQYFPKAETLLTLLTNGVKWDGTKSDAISSEFRNRGNQYFRQRQFQPALRAYNLALSFAPEPSPALGLAYANRSAIWTELGHDHGPLLQAALDDVDLALEHGYPIELHAKLELRRETVLNKMTTLDLSLEARAEQIKRFKTETLFKVQNPAESLPSAESSVRINFTPECGRELIVTEDVPVGTTLIVEEPFTKMLSQSLNWDFDHCHSCCKPVLCGIPCKGCVFVMFCSLACLNTALSTFHRYECPCWHYLYQSDLPRNPSDLTRSPPVYEPGSYSNVYQLVSHVAHNSYLDLFSNTIQALLIVTILDRVTPFFAEFDPEFDLGLTRNFVQALILHHLQNLPCNSLALEEVKGQLANGRKPVSDSESIRTSKLEQYASGVYPTVSLINHSCDPNVTRLVDPYNNGQMAIVTLKNLKPGQPLLLSYTKSFTADEVSERHEYLKKNYYFDCACVPCTDKWPLLPELLKSDPVFRCVQCGSAVQQSKCRSKCKKYRAQKVMNQWNTNVSEFYACYDLVLQNQPLEAIDKLKPVLTYFHHQVVEPNGKYVLALETLKRALDLVVYF